MRSFVSVWAALVGMAALFASVSGLPAQTAPPSVINFQGRLATPSGNPVPDGTYSIRFRFYDAATAGNVLYQMTIASVAVRNGTFAVTLDALITTIFNGNTWIGIKIGDDAELEPRTQIVSVPYALKSNLALTVPDNSIATAKFQNNAVTNAKLASDALSLNKVSGGVLNIANGGLVISNGIIQNTNNSFSTFGELGLYSQIANRAITFVTTNGAFLWFMDGGAGLTPVMVMTGAGSLGIGTAAPKQRLHVNGDYYGKGHVWFHAFEGDGSSGVAYLQARDTSGSSSIAMQLRTQNGGGVVETLRMNPDGRGHYRGTFWSNVNFSIGSAGLAYGLSVEGEAVAHDWNTNSDARLKQNIETVPDAITTLLGLRGVTYEWKPDAFTAKQGSKGRRYGFLAQEVEEVLPALVKDGFGGYKAVNYDGIIPVAVEAIKAQQSQIALLRKQNDAVMSENSAIRKENAVIRAQLEAILRRLDGHK